MYRTRAYSLLNKAELWLLGCKDMNMSYFTASPFKDGDFGGLNWL